MKKKHKIEKKVNDEILKLANELEELLQSLGFDPLPIENPDEQSFAE